MIINHFHKFVFVHVPETAGSAVSSMLTGLTTYRDLEIGELGQGPQTTLGPRFGLTKHAEAHRIRRVMGEADWAEYFSFGFVQRPFSRLVSIYHFLKSWGNLPEPWASEMATVNTFEEFLQSDLWIKSDGPSGIFRPQTTWLTAKDDPRKLIVDFVGRQETLADDLDRIAEGIGDGVFFDTSQISDVTSSDTKSVEWTEKRVNRVVDRYLDDFQLLGYPFAPNAGFEARHGTSRSREDDLKTVRLCRDTLEAHRKVVRRAPGAWHWVIVEDTGILVHPTMGGRPSVVALDINLASAVTGFALTLESPNPLAPEVEFMVAVFRHDVELKLDARVPDPLPHDLVVAATSWLPVRPGSEMPVELKLPVGRRGPLQLVLATRVTGPTVDYAHSWFRDIRVVTKA